MHRILYAYLFLGRTESGGIVVTLRFYDLGGLIKAVPMNSTQLFQRLLPGFLVSLDERNRKTHAIETIEVKISPFYIFFDTIYKISSKELNFQKGFMQKTIILT